MNKLFTKAIEHEHGEISGAFECGIHIPENLFWVRRNRKGHYLTSKLFAKWDHKKNSWDFVINNPTTKEKIFLRQLNAQESHGFINCRHCYGWGAYWKHPDYFEVGMPNECPTCGGSGRTEPLPEQLTLQEAFPGAREENGDAS